MADPDSLLTPPTAGSSRACSVTSSCGAITLIFNKCLEPGLSVPKYYTGEDIEASVEVSGRYAFAFIAAELKGIAEFSAAGARYEQTICSVKCSLKCEVNSDVGRCPLRVSLPGFSKSRLGAELFPLPPTFVSNNYMRSARVKYGLYVEVVKSRLGGLWSSRGSLSSPIIYVSSQQSVPRLPRHTTCLGVGPDAMEMHDWIAHETLLVKYHPYSADIHSKLYIPNRTVFSMRYKIPFRLYLYTDSAEGLISFLCPSRRPTLVVDTRNREYGISSKSKRPPPTRILVKRTVSMNALPNANADTFQTIKETIGVGAFHFADVGEGWMAWYGNISMSPSLTSGGFMMRDLVVQDSIELTMVPESTFHAALYTLRMSVPIVLIAEPPRSETHNFEIKGYEVARKPLPEIDLHSENQESTEIVNEMRALPNDSPRDVWNSENIEVDPFEDGPPVLLYDAEGNAEFNLVSPVESSIMDEGAVELDEDDDSHTGEEFTHRILDPDLVGQHLMTEMTSMSEDAHYALAPDVRKNGVSETILAESNLAAETTGGNTDMANALERQSSLIQSLQAQMEAMRIEVLRLREREAEAEALPTYDQVPRS